VTITLIAAVALALFFDFTNGFHDAANAIATTVSTRALSPRLAVLMAGVLNFAGAFISIKVATTVAKGVINSSAVSADVVLAAVVGAIVWNLVTWYLGLPTSSSHALIGGIAGAGIGAGGFRVVQWGGVVQKILIPSALSVAIGMVLASLIVLAILWVFRRVRPSRISRGFRRVQVVSAAFVAVAHGTNDAQKTMGVIALALLVSHPTHHFEVPVWVIASAATAMAFGTYAGGWRIINTVGRRVTHLEPYQGFAAETSTAAILFTTAQLGFPVSTTHTISGSVLGAGGVRNPNAVRWGIVRSIITAWLFTFPAAGVVAVVMSLLTRIPGGTALVFALAVTFSALLFAARRRADARPARTVEDPVSVAA
jgi:PiT family inorganic phosphate transporter